MALWRSFAWSSFTDRQCCFKKKLILKPLACLILNVDSMEKILSLVTNFRIFIQIRITVKNAIVFHNESRFFNDYNVEAVAKGICTANMLLKRQLKMRGIYLLPLLIFGLLFGTCLAFLLKSTILVHLLLLDILYLCILLGFGTVFSIRSKSFIQLLFLPILAMSMHCFYGTGFILGSIGIKSPVKGENSPKLSSFFFKRNEAHENTDMGM